MSELENKRIFLKFEKFEKPDGVELEQLLERDEEKNVYIMGFASTPDENSQGFIVENSALLECWKKVKSEGRNVAVYEKHDKPIGKTVSCEEYNGKVLITMEIPKKGNERVLSVYEQGIYVGLSIGGWQVDGHWDDNDIFHVTEFDWVENSLTDIPANENALLLEYANNKKAQEELERKKELELENEKKTFEEQSKCLENILDKIRGI